MFIDVFVIRFSKCNSSLSILEKIVILDFLFKSKRIKYFAKEKKSTTHSDFLSSKRSSCTDNMALVM